MDRYILGINFSQSDNIDLCGVRATKHYKRSHSHRL